MTEWFRISWFTNAFLLPVSYDCCEEDLFFSATLLRVTALGKYPLLVESKVIMKQLNYINILPSNSHYLQPNCCDNKAVTILRLQLKPFSTAVINSKRNMAGCLCVATLETLRAATSLRMLLPSGTSTLTVARSNCFLLSTQEFQRCFALISPL